MSMGGALLCIARDVVASELLSSVNRNTAGWPGLDQREGWVARLGPLLKLSVPLLRSLRRSSVLREVVPHRHCFYEDSEAMARSTLLADQVGPLRRSQQEEATPAVATAFRSCAESTRPTQAVFNDESARGQHVP